jgi:hypothetical protein
MIAVALRPFAVCLAVAFLAACTSRLLGADPDATDPTPSDAAPTVPESPAAPGDALVNPLPAFLANVKLDHADGRYVEGERVRVEFQVEQEANVYLLYHQADGNCKLLFPNPAQPDNRVAAKTPVTIPAAGSKFRFRVRPPLGAEALQVLAAAEPIAELAALDFSARVPDVAPAVLKQLAQRIAAEPGQFAEHRVRLETLPAGQAPAARPAKRVGLFIGVNDYADPASCHPMICIRNGAQRMQAAFTGRGGVAAEDALLITGADATRANIEAAVTQWLPSVTQPGDTVFVYYCGHGTLVPNVDGSEPDLNDEALTTYDNDLGEVASEEERITRMRQQYILDDTLARWLLELPGRQVVLFLETCKGGGAVDAVVSLNRFFAEEGPRVRDLTAMNLLVVMGCLPDENTAAPQDAEDAVPHMATVFAALIEDESLVQPVSVQDGFQLYHDIIRQNIGGAQNPNMLDHILLPVPLVP